MHRMLSEIHKLLFTPLLVGTTTMAWGQGQADPPSWWSNLEDGRVEVLLSFPEATQWPEDVALTDGEVQLLSWRKAALPSHAWVELDVSQSSREHQVHLEVKWPDKRMVRVPWTAHSEMPAARRMDDWETLPAMYLIMPDRFANGDESNDVVAGMREQGVNREEMYARHGGDLQGIANHLPYLQDLGVGAIWLTPVLENDLSRTSYHGYACTDNYKVDPRLGTLEDYKDMVRRAHNSGIRVVQDWVPNHWGNLHRLLTHPVDSAWVHQWSGGFQDSKRTHYRGTTVFDPYVTEGDWAGFNEGWFDQMMPDMNQSQGDLQRYMGTSMLWWMAEVGIDGLRIDTYTYGEPDAMASMTKRIAEAFPECFMFAEAWVYGTAKQAALVEGAPFGWGAETGLDGVVDFAWHFAMQEAVHQGEGWEHGIGRVYEVLAEDFLYPNPNRLVTFLDNHDTHRWIAEAGSADKARAGLAMLLLGRGMPCLYYGTELGFATRCEPDGLVRQDMPGGWAGDARNAFEAEGRTDEEQRWHQWVQGLLRLRQTHQSAMLSSMQHLYPRRGVYAFAHVGTSSSLVVIVNAASEARPIPWDDMNSWLSGRTVSIWSPDGPSVPLDPESMATLDSWQTIVLEVAH